MKRPKLPKINPGDLVLIGSVRLQPMHWFAATVLLAFPDEVATEHEPPSSRSPQRQFIPIKDIRAVAGPSDYVALLRFKEEACRTAKAEARVVTEAESALGRARDAMWDKLEQIGATTPRLHTSGEPV